MENNDILKNNKIVIGYDTRQYSYTFSNICGKVLNKLGFKIIVFKGYTQTPMLSFMIKKLKCIGGIMITASHNPYNYNGIKLYNSDGGQLTNEQSKMFKKIFNKEYDYFETDKGIYIPEKINKKYYLKYYQTLEKLCLFGNDYNNYNIIVSPLHGTSIKYIDIIFQKLKYNYQIPDSQNIVDPLFSTIKSPNPEEIESFKESLKLSKKVKADLILAIDPDSDRIGALCFNNKNGLYYHMNGNEVAAIIFYFLCENNFYNANILNDKMFFVTTIVSNDLIEKIGKDYNVDCFRVLTGFKNINEKLISLAKENYSFVLAFEESCGYLALDSVGDKDAFQGAILIVEALKYYKKKNISLYNLLQNLYKKYGYYIDKQITYRIVNQNNISYIMDNFRNIIKNTEMFNIYKFCDYYEGKEYDNNMTYIKDTEYKNENIIKVYFDKESWFAVRPSGTEPKVKIYISSVDKSKEKAMMKLKLIEEKINMCINER